MLVRSDGSPAYNFAVVIDDALMEMTLVIRGEDHISNTPRQLLLYEAFGWTPPLFGHLPFVLGPDHSKLSKRHGATSVSEFRERGYLPEALANYLALIGWSPGEGEELLPLDELARRFRIEDVGKSAGVFDPEKLAWVNRHYMKGAAPDRLARLALPFLQQQGWVTRTLSDAGARLSGAGSCRWRRHRSIGSSRCRSACISCSTIPPLARWAIRPCASGRRKRRAAWHRGARRMNWPASGRGWTDRDLFRAAATRIRERSGAKGKALFHPIRVALTGEAEGVELDLAVPLIDRGAAISGRLMPVVSCIGASRAPPIVPARSSMRIDVRRRMIIYGINPVLEALRAGRVKEVRLSSAGAPGGNDRLHQLAAIAGGTARSVCGACRPMSSSANRAAGVHQGVVADIEDMQYVYDVEELVRGASGPPLIVVLDGIEDPQNLGAILRTADAAGVDGVVVQNRRSAARDGAAAKASAGALAHVKIAEVVNIARAIEELKEAGVWTVGLAADAADDLRCVRLHAADRGRPWCRGIGIAASGS